MITKSWKVNVKKENNIWEKIKEREGESFHLSGGEPLVYKVEGDSISHNRTKGKISKSSFEKAVEINPKTAVTLSEEKLAALKSII